MKIDFFTKVKMDQKVTYVQLMVTSTNLFYLWIFLFCFDSKILEVRLQHLQKFLGCFISRRSTYKRHYYFSLLLSTVHTHKLFLFITLIGQNLRLSLHFATLGHATL